MERRNILRMKLTLENVLLNWREHYGENTEFRFETGTRFKRPYINLSLEGEAFDPTDTEDDFSDVSACLLAGLGLYPTYSHSKNVNTVSVKLKKRPANPVAVLLLAMAAAIVLGSLGLLLPEGVRTAGHDYLLTPLYDTLIGLLSTVAVTCERDLGIDPKINNFSVPLSMVLYKPMSAVNFMVFAVFFTKQYALDVSVLWLISTVLVVTILAIAFPPIPGGAFTCFAILFTQLGIPAEALGIVMVMNAFVDFICTGLDTVLRQCELVLAVDKVKMLDRSVLQRKKK